MISELTTPRTRLCVIAALVLSATANAAVHEVMQVGISFVPQDIVVAPGDTVRWVWSGGSHTVTSGDPVACSADGVFFNQSLNSANPMVEWVVPASAVFVEYFCAPHCQFGMIGSITVLLPGDLNCDGVVNFGDIDPFVLALTDAAGYVAAFPDCDMSLADINGDGAVNFGDIDPFVELLTSG